MFRKIAALLSAFLIVSTTPLAAAPVIPLTIVKAVPMDQDIAGMLVGDANRWLCNCAKQRWFAEMAAQLL
jgi:hypothetical protein